ncbi:MAG: tetratricopeptide repeat protein [Cyanobacteriota bacterium]
MISDFAEMDVKTQQSPEGVDLTAPGELLLAEIETSLATQDATEISHWVRAHCKAVKNWLKRYKTKHDASALEQVISYLEALHHLCQIREWQYISSILSTEVDVNDSIEEFSLSLYDYLIFKGLNTTLLKSSQEIIITFKDASIDLSNVTIFKARALAATGKFIEACDIFKEIYFQLSQLPDDSETFLAAKVHLCICQAQLGIYSPTITDLQQALITINNKLDSYKSLSLLQLKTGILESLAFCNMNHGKFREALELYSQTIKIKRDNKLFISNLSTSLVHQGIIYRRINPPNLYIFRLFYKGYKNKILSEAIEENYELAKEYLMEAKSLAELVADTNGIALSTHHLAWVFLNQGKKLLAEEYCNISIKEYIKREDERGASDCYEQLGRIYLSRGNEYLDEAEENLRKSMNIRTDIGNRHGIASCILNLSFVSWHRGQYLEALAYLFKSFYAYWRIGVLNFSRLAKMLALFYVWTLGKRNWTI